MPWHKIEREDGSLADLHHHSADVTPKEGGTANGDKTNRSRHRRSSDARGSGTLRSVNNRAEHLGSDSCVSGAPSNVGSQQAATPPEVGRDDCGGGGDSAPAVCC